MQRFAACASLVIYRFLEGKPFGPRTVQGNKPPSNMDSFLAFRSLSALFRVLLNLHGLNYPWIIGVAVVSLNCGPVVLGVVKSVALAEGSNRRWELTIPN